MKDNQLIIFEYQFKETLNKINNDLLFNTPDPIGSILYSIFQSNSLNNMYSTLSRCVDIQTYQFEKTFETNIKEG